MMMTPLSLEENGNIKTKQLIKKSTFIDMKVPADKPVKGRGGGGGGGGRKKTVNTVSVNFWRDFKLSRTVHTRE